MRRERQGDAKRRKLEMSEKKEKKNSNLAYSRCSIIADDRK